MMYKIDNLKKEFKSKCVLNSLSFQINKGEILGVVGRNGSGKTTLVKLLTRILSPTSGVIKFEEKNLEEIGASYYASISSVLEGDRNMYWYLSGLENILYFAALQKIDKKKAIQLANPLLKEFKLYEQRNNKVYTYSRGMKQKLSIIISLISEPKVLFLDEPTLGLDVISKKSMIDILQSINRSHNVTMIITSHEFGFLENVCDKLLLLEDDSYQIIDDIDYFLNEFISEEYKIRFISENKEIIDGIDLPINIVDNYYEIVIESNLFEDINNYINYLIKNECQVISIVRSTVNLETVFLKLWEDKK